MYTIGRLKIIYTFSEYKLSPCLIYVIFQIRNEREEDFLMGFRCVGKYWVIACLLISFKTTLNE